MRAAFMQNMRVQPGVVKCRSGTGVVFATSGQVTTIFNWIEPLIGQPGVWQGAPTGTNGLLLGHIDAPNAPEYVFPVVPTGHATFFGWSIAGPVNTTASVTLAIDGVSVGAATIGIPRTDVADAFPGNAGSPNFGWSKSVDITPYTSGILHSVVVTFTDSAANTTVATSTFFVTRPPTGAENLVLYQDGAIIKRYRQSDGDIATVLTEDFASRAITFEPFNASLYFAGYDVFDDGTMQVEIYDGSTTIKAFRSPLFFLSSEVTVTDAGPGQCTLGTHIFGLVYQNRTGYLGPPTIYLGTGGYLASITLSSDGRTIDVNVALDAQIDGGGTATLFLIMTRADNPNNWFYVPTDPVTGSIGDLPVPLNMATTLHFVASISDEDLAASADPANDQFLVMSQAGDGTGPFSPNFVVAYGTRMCYGVGVQLFVSDLDAPQQLTADQHVVRMTTQRQIAYAFPLSGSTNLFLTGEGWTSYVTDNGDVPSTWAPPVTSSASLGAPFPACVCFRTRGPYAWIVTDGGVYLFNGEFSEKPVTYLVNDQWARVNWKAAYAITVVDDVPSLRCYVAVPLDGATEPTHMFCIDYTNGLSFDQVDISLDVFAWGQFSSIGVVREIATGTTNLWFGPSSAGYVARFDGTNVNDVVWA